MTCARVAGTSARAIRAGDVMWAMGLSWHGTVEPLLDKKRYLPIERAKELIAMIEARQSRRPRGGRK
jgi:hypothetical protein